MREHDSIIIQTFFSHPSKSVKVVVIVQVEVSLNSPLTELVEQYYSSMVLINLFECCLRVFHLQVPSVHQSYCLFELGQIDSSVVVSVNSVKRNPIFVILAEVAEEILEFGEGNVFWSIFNFRFELVLGCLEGSHDGWLCVE